MVNNIYDQKIELKKNYYEKRVIVMKKVWIKIWKKPLIMR